MVRRADAPAVVCAPAPYIWCKNRVPTIYRPPQPSAHRQASHNHTSSQAGRWYDWIWSYGKGITKVLPRFATDGPLLSASIRLTIKADERDVFPGTTLASWVLRGFLQMHAEDENAGCLGVLLSFIKGLTSPRFGRQES